MTSEAAPRTDQACTAPLPGASLPGAPDPSQPRTFTQETPFGILAQLYGSTRLKTSSEAAPRDRRGMHGTPFRREPAGHLRPVAGLVLSAGNPVSKIWLECKDRHGSRRLARLRLRPTRHARRPLLARACRVPPTRRSLVPSRGNPLSKTWLECKDRRGSRRLVPMPDDASTVRTDNGSPCCHSTTHPSPSERRARAILVWREIPE